jgi:hypothetical protein
MGTNPVSIQVWGLTRREGRALAAVLSQFVGKLIRGWLDEIFHKFSYLRSLFKVALALKTYSEPIPLYLALTTQSCYNDKFEIFLTIALACTLKLRAIS